MSPTESVREVPVRANPAGPSSEGVVAAQTEAADVSLTSASVEEAAATDHNETDSFGKGAVPTTERAEGALAKGHVVNIFETRNCGFLLQYFTVGVIYGGLPSTLYGLFLGYLNVPSYIYATTGVIITLPWSFKFLFGFLNDCVPICGARRKPYMVIGWALCAAMLVGLYLCELPEPYYCIKEDGYYDRRAPPCNPDAQDAGGFYAMLMCFAALGYVVADVAADGLMVEYARREPERKRGRVQTMIYLVRTLGQVGSVGLVGLGMNGKQYTGSFDWSLSFNEICLIFAAPALLMVPVSACFVQEIPERDREVSLNMRQYARGTWDMLSSKAAFFVVIYFFFGQMVGQISTTASGLVKREWAGVKVLQQQMFQCASLLLFALGLWLVKKYFLNYSWRKMLLFTLVFLNATDLLIANLTIFDIVRDQYFYLGETVLDEIPTAANFIVSTFVIVEMADSGNEGLVYGLLTTIANLATPVARAIGNQVFGHFGPSLSDDQNYIKDSDEFRRTVAWSFALSFAFSMASLAFLCFLPSQKAEAQRRKKDWPRNAAYAYMTCTLVVCAFAYSLTVNVMTMIPTTACLEFVGGPGC